MKKYSLILLCFVITLVSCRKDLVVDTKEPIDPTETNYIKNVYGVVEDELGEPVRNVELSIQGKSVTTNQVGMFTLFDVSIADLKGTYIQASHKDYFNTGARIYAKSQDKDFVKIVLVKKNLNKTFDAGKSNNLTFNNGTKIEFLTGEMTHNGMPYSGKVSLYAYHLDPSKEDFLSRSPGDLSAVNEEGEFGILRSFGMLVVELRGSSNEELQLAPGSKAQITIPVPNDLQNSANPTIPLWHFDEEKGIWIEEGQANLVDGVYVGEVSHFSWWNCDDFSDPISLCVQLVQPQRNSYFTEVKVELTSSVFGVTCDYTDADGRVCGLVPANELLTIKVYDECGNVIYESTIGPYTSGPVEEVIDPNLSGLDNFIFTGKVSECGTINGLSDAYIFIEADGQTLYTTTDANGDYYVEKLLCSTSINYTISAIHHQSGKTGSASNSGVAEVPLVQDFDLCDDNPYVLIMDSLGSVIYQEINATLKVKPNETILFATANFIAGFQGASEGTFPINTLINFDIFRKANSTVTITQWGNVGTFIKGEFSLNGGNVTGLFTALRTE